MRAPGTISLLLLVYLLTVACGVAAQHANPPPPPPDCAAMRAEQARISELISTQCLNPTPNLAPRPPPHPIQDLLWWLLPISYIAIGVGAVGLARHHRRTGTVIVLLRH